MGILFIFLVLLTVACYVVNKEEVLAPSLLFSAAFVFSGAWALAYREKWSTVLSLETCLVIGVGVLVYALTTWFIRLISGRVHVGSAFGTPPTTAINLPTVRAWFFLAFCTFIAVFYARALMNTTGISSLGSAITTYRQASVSGSTVSYSLPSWINYGRNVVNASGYWFAYIIARDLYVNHKTPLVNLLIMIVSMFDYSLSGGRMGAVTQLLAIACIYLSFKMQEKKSGRFLSARQILLILFLVVIVLFSAQGIGHLMGRTVQYNAFDYIAIYVGAEFHNLNVFVVNRLGAVDNSIFGGQTFRNLLNPFMYAKGQGYYYDLPYINSNGYFLGNVGTTFYAPLYDFGFVGCMMAVAVMAAITQLNYQAVKLCNHVQNKVPFRMVFYGYIFNTVIFGFFSDWFYENTVSLVFIEYLLFWWLFNLYFFSSFHVTSRKKVNEE